MHVGASQSERASERNTRVGVRISAVNTIPCDSERNVKELEWVRPVIVFHAAIAVKPKASKMYYT